MQQSVYYSRGGIRNTMRLGLKTILYATSMLSPSPKTSAFSFTSRTIAQDKHHQNATFIEDSTSSLAHMASSPERFAAALNMTIEEVDEAINARKMASTTLNEQLISIEKNNKDNMTGAEIGRRKHQMICQHRFNHFRNAFVCKKCWTFTPICVCHLFEQRGRGETNSDSRSRLPQGVEKLIVWTHHDEYGRTSNTGSLLPLGLQQTEILMKGLLDHEQIMHELLCRKDVTPVVLWPDKQGKRASTTIANLKRKIEESSSNNSQNEGSDNGGIVLISIEGTWNTARKMVNKLPPHVLRLDLSEEIRLNFTTPEMNEGIFIDNSITAAGGSSPSPSAPSLLSPLRRQGKGAKQDCVSTLEATIVALLALGLSVDEASFILNCARTKVKRIQEYTGKTYPRD